MILGIGTDLLEVRRMEAELPQPGFREELFTPWEIAYCDSKYEPARHYAARFAAKEALIKALAAGTEPGYYWQEIEVQHGPEGAPCVVLSGRVKQIAERLGVGRIHVSLSHTAELTSANVILES